MKFAHEQSQSRSPQYQCTYQIWRKSIEIYSSYCPKSKTLMYCGQITPSKIDEISPIAIPKQISTISMHTPSLVTIHWYLLKLSSRNENTDVSRADNSVEYWRRLPISNPKPDLHNINVHTKFSENPNYYPEIKILTYRGQITQKLTKFAQ